MELKPGDVVTLKSGGHLLTVAEVHQTTAACLWMGLEGDLYREMLPLVVLELADADEAEDEDDEEDEEDEDEDDEEGPRENKRA